METLCGWIKIYFIIWILQLLDFTSAAGGATRNEQWSKDSVIATLNSPPPTVAPFLPQLFNPGAAGQSRSIPGVFRTKRRNPSVFTFHNTKGQFLEMPKWIRNRASLSSKFTFDFYTGQASGMLLYFDDGGPNDYVELLLLRSQLAMLYKFGTTEELRIAVGDGLSDNSWHSVVMEISTKLVRLTVDNDLSAEHSSQRFLNLISPVSSCFIGGIPQKTPLERLSKPAAFFDPGFTGKIRRYAVNGEYQRLTRKEKVSEDKIGDVCYPEVNPCKNNGVCYPLNNEPTCLCAETGFYGKNCDEASDYTATFNGSGWFEYDLTGKHISSERDTISLSFKTKQSNGMLLHTGMSSDFVTLSIKDGSVKLVANLGAGAFSVVLEPVLGTFSDNVWHDVKVIRKLHRVNLTVDRAQTTQAFTQEQYSHLSLNDVFYVGGTHATSFLPGRTVKTNFIGCIRDVIYRNNQGTHEISRLATQRDRSVRVVGNVPRGCADIDRVNPVFIKTSEAFLIVSPWRDRIPQLSIKFEFKTIKQRGLLLFVTENTTNNFIALELFQGNLFIVFDFSASRRRTNVTAECIADGLWHSVSLTIDRYKNRVLLNVDNGYVLTSSLGVGVQPSLRGPIHMGGTDFSTIFASGRTPNLLWATSLRSGFIGCVRNVMKNGGKINLQAMAKQQYQGTSSISPECPNYETSYCQSQPCRNGGICKTESNTFSCDCTLTGFTGKTCEKAATTVAFNGSQNLCVAYAVPRKYQAEEISFRFKSPMNSGLLFTTSSSSVPDILNIRLIKGVVTVTYNVDRTWTNCTSISPRQGASTLSQGAYLNDNQWHSIAVKRFGRFVTLSVDGAPTKGIKLGKGHIELQLNNIHIGKVSGDVMSTTCQYLSPPFVGTIQNLRFNKDEIIEACFRKTSNTPSCQFNGTWGESIVISNPMTFDSKSSYVLADMLDAYNEMNLYFTLRTTVSDGLILYNGGSSGDFIAVELSNGYIRYVYNLGNGPQFLSAADQKGVVDGEWHEVRIIRSTENTHTLSVDGVPLTQDGRRDNVNLDLSGDLYIGGVRQDLYATSLPDEIQSRNGFQGCLATLDLNGITPDLIKVAKVTSGRVTSGCTGPYNECDSLPCQHGGKCLQEWNGYSCDCSLTAYTGWKCEKYISSITDRTSYKFNAGIMIYNWPSNNLPSSRNDTLVVGFSTTSRNCIIAMIKSGLKTDALKDFMQLAIVNRRLMLTYNIGSKSTTLKGKTNVANGQYHVATIRRYWMNASMQLDNLPLQKVSPRGEKNTVFNSKSSIQIGGWLDASVQFMNSSTLEKRIMNPFIGVMSGFTFNGIRVFTEAEFGNSNIKILGNVGLQRFNDNIASTPSSTTTTATVTMTTFTTASTRPLSSYNESGCNEQMCPEGKGNFMRNRGETMLADDQTSQITPRGDILPPVATLTDNAISVTSTASQAQKPNVTTTQMDYYNITYNSSDSRNNSGMGNLWDNGPGVKIGIFGNFFNGTTAMVAGIVGGTVIIVVLLLFAIIKFKNRDDNTYRKGYKAPSNARTIGNNHRNGSVPTKKKHSRKKSDNDKNMDKEYFV